MDNQEFIDKLYVGASTSNNSNSLIPYYFTSPSEFNSTRGFHPKSIKIETNPEEENHKFTTFFRTRQNFHGKLKMGGIIMQNWTTKNSIPSNIGKCLNLPIIIDKKKMEKTYINNFKRQLYEMNKKYAENKRIFRSVSKDMFKEKKSKKEIELENERNVNPGRGKDYVNYNVSSKSFNKNIIFNNEKKIKAKNNNNF